MRNEQSRDSGNIGHKTLNEDKQSKKLNTETQKMGNTNPSKNQ